MLYFGGRPSFFTTISGFLSNQNKNGKPFINKIMSLRDDRGLICNKAAKIHFHSNLWSLLRECHGIPSANKSMAAAIIESGYKSKYLLLESL